MIDSMLLSDEILFPFSTLRNAYSKFWKYLLNSKHRKKAMELLRVSNDREFEPPDFSFQDHGMDLRLDEPSRVSSHDRRNSQHSVTDSLLATPNRPESWQQVSSLSSSSTAQSTNLNLPAQPLQNTNPSMANLPIDTVIWKINWQQPTFMCSMLLCGLILAIGHHVYYHSLSGSPAGDATRQAWSIRFGTAFAFLVVACFKAITVSALGQYLWSVVRSKCLKISTYYSSLPIKDRFF